jgi:UDP-N-acetyl-D-mannosaminouronate:lipid I N-acetyl-D-mannosaminouronosyltransferase
MKYERLNGINVCAPSTRTELINFAIKHRKILIAINAEKILHANNHIRKIINSNLGYPDGMGAVWALRKKGFNDVIKIPGCELWLEIIAHHYKTKKFYFVGGKEEVIEEVIVKLHSEFIGINILNYRNGYISNKLEQTALINDIEKQKPDIVFVAMGSPKQELLMELMHNHHKATYQGLGGSFDVYTGHVKRAPKLWINKNLEWAYRLFKQPLRIKRQMHLLRFYILLKLNKL